MSIYDQEAPTGAFLNINKIDGKKATVRFFGEPIMWDKETEFSGKKEVRVRFATLCLYRNQAAKASEVKVYEFGWSVQKILKSLAKDDDWGDPTGYDITITATGEGLTTEYQIVPRPKKELSGEDKALVEACTIDLRKACKADGEPAAPADDYSPFEDD